VGCWDRKITAQILVILLQHCFAPSNPNTARHRIIISKSPLPREEHQGCNRARHQWEQGEGHPDSWMQQAWEVK